MMCHSGMILSMIVEWLVTWVISYERFTWTICKRDLLGFSYVNDLWFKFCKFDVLIKLADNVFCLAFGHSNCLPVLGSETCCASSEAYRQCSLRRNAWDFTLKRCPRADLTNLTTQLPPEDLMGKEGPWFGRRSTSMQLTLLLRQVQCAGWECRSSLWIWRFHGWKSY